VDDLKEPPLSPFQHKFGTPIAGATPINRPKKKDEVVLRLSYSRPGRSFGTVKAGHLTPVSLLTPLAGEIRSRSSVQNKKRLSFSNEDASTASSSNMTPMLMSPGPSPSTRLENTRKQVSEKQKILDEINMNDMIRTEAVKQLTLCRDIVSLFDAACHVFLRGDTWRFKLDLVLGKTGRKLNDVDECLNKLVSIADGFLTYKEVGTQKILIIPTTYKKKSKEYFAKTTEINTTLFNLKQEALSALENLNHYEAKRKDCYTIINA
jgi:hypothetical protein